MTKDTVDIKGRTLLREGTILSINNFQTDDGYHTIRVIQHEGRTYWHSMRNGEIVNVIEIVSVDQS